MDTMANRSGLQAEVLKYFNERPGQLLFRDDIANDLSLTQAQVTSAMHKLCDSVKTAQMFRKAAPETWTFNPNGHKPVVEVEKEPVKKAVKAVTSGRMFEEVTETKDGEILIKDEDDRFYLARRIS